MRHKYEVNKQPVKHNRRALMLISGLVLCVSVLAYFVFLLHGKPSAQSVQTSSQKKVAAPVLKPAIVTPGLPVRIQVPRINADAKIDYMGLTKAGDMESPVKVENGGWYKHGPSPGALGSAVVAGHKTGLNGEPGLFSDLGKLQKGDKIVITDDKGQIITFTVREARSYDQNDKPDEVFNSTSGAHLNLITCVGSWNATDRSFSKRLVVFSDRVN